MAAEVATEERSEPKAEKPEMSGQEVRAEVEAVLRQLPACTSREAADEVALAFCYVNSKGSRRRLVRPPPLDLVGLGFNAQGLPGGNDHDVALAFCCVISKGARRRLATWLIQGLGLRV